MAREEIPSIYYWQIVSEALNIFLASSKKGAVRVGISLADGWDGPDYIKNEFPTHRIVEDYEMNRPLIKAVETALEEHTEAEGLPLDIKGTSFQLKAWKAIARIPYGQTRTYGDVARMVGRPGGARAVGQAMGRNPLPLIYP